MQKVVKRESGYQIEGYDAYVDNVGIQHTITWKRLINEADVPEITRRIHNENLDEAKRKARNKKLRLSVRKNRPIR